jgi:probable rRNA maturation factor
MLKRSPIHVEVCVQDCFFGEGPINHFSEPVVNQIGDDVVQAKVPLPIPEQTWETWFQVWLEALHPDLSPIGEYELSLRLTDDVEVRSLNAQYRQQDKPTDVLAFAALEVDYPVLQDFDAALPVYLGDIVISVETAQQQAQQQQHSLQRELAWLATHGLLHLLGWDHPDEACLLQMLDQQQQLLNLAGPSLEDV